jgi:hypothetical protein
MLYHYTRLRNLDKIFGEDKITLRMYDSRWMNDPSESKVLQGYILKYRDEISLNLTKKANELLKEAIAVSHNFDPNKILPSFLYVLSFSRVMDSNIFWGSKYSGLNGFSITFDESLIFSESTNKIGFNKLDEVYYFKSIEGEADKNDIKHICQKLQNLADSILCSDSKIKKEEFPFIMWDNITNFLAIFHKHPSWSHELEKRLVILKKSRSNYIGNDPENRAVFFLPSSTGKDGLNVYGDNYKIDFDNDINPRPFIEINLEKDAVNQITLGPNLNEIDIEAVRNYFYKNDYNKVSVLPSGAQIR